MIVLVFRDCTPDVTVFAWGLVLCSVLTVPYSHGSKLGTRMPSPLVLCTRPPEPPAALPALTDDTALDALPPPSVFCTVPGTPRANPPAAVRSTSMLAMGKS